MNPKLLLTPWYLQPLASHVLNKSILIAPNSFMMIASSCQQTQLNQLMEKLKNTVSTTNNYFFSIEEFNMQASHFFWEVTLRKIQILCKEKRKIIWNPKCSEIVVVVFLSGSKFHSLYQTKWQDDSQRLWRRFNFESAWMWRNGFSLDSYARWLAIKNSI